MEAHQMLNLPMAIHSLVCRACMPPYGVQVAAIRDRGVQCGHEVLLGQGMTVLLLHAVHLRGGPSLISGAELILHVCISVSPNSA